jgi:hypothetical protein
MAGQGRNGFCVAAVLAVMGLIPASGQFVLPAEGPVAFRRDKLPLEVGGMMDLSKRLETLARGVNGKTAAERRGAAQMLALALALDPANASARDFLAEFKQGNRRLLANNERLTNARAAIRQYLGWLESPEAGSQGRALAACLQDILAISEPKAAEGSAEAEKGAWAGWIPEVAAYEIKPVVKETQPEEVTPPPQPVAESKIALSEAQVQVPQWRRVGKSMPVKWELAAASLQMTAKKTDPESQNPNSFTITVGNGQGPLNQTGSMLQRLLKQHHEKFPRGYQLRITSKEMDQWAQLPGPKKRPVVSAAAAVLASAAISGKEPTGTIIGEVNESGAFTLPASFWDQLRSLEGGPGGRLIVPAAAADDLAAMLAMEKPEFFLRYEVLAAADFKQLLALTAKEPEGDFGKTLTKFQEIRERAGKQDVRQYIANRFVRQRLSEVLQEAPFHVSARMLLIQSAGKRPVTVSRPVLAAELRRAIEPAAPLTKYEIYQLRDGEAVDVGKVFNACRAQVDQLDRFAEKNDRELIGRVRNVVDSIRSLDKSLRGRGENYMISEAAQLAQAELVSAYKAIMKELDAMTGEPAPPADPGE